MGDFNDVCYPSDREGQAVFDEVGVANFNNMIKDTGVVEVDTTGGF